MGRSFAIGKPLTSIKIYLMWHLVMLFSQKWSCLGDNEAVLAPSGQATSGELPPQLDAAIDLPPSLFRLIGDRTNVGIFFALYDTPTLFPVDGGRFLNVMERVERAVGSRVLAATVGPGINFENLQDPVTIVLRVQPVEGMVRYVHYILCQW